MAGVELATAYVSLVASSRDMGKQIVKEVGDAGDDAGKEGGERAGSAFSSRLGGFLKKSLTGIGITAGVALGGVVVKGFGDAFAQSDATSKFKQSLDFAGISKAAIATATAATQKYADATVYDLSTVQNTAAQLAANGVKNFTGLTEAAGNLNAVAGGNADTFKSVAMVLTQTIGAGKLTTENWNQIADAIPGASGVLQKALLKNKAFTGDFRDAMAHGEITADEFNKALLQLGNKPIAVQAATSTATFEGAMGNLMATITGGFAKFLNNVKPQLTAIIDAISTGFGKAFDAIKKVFNFIGDNSTVFGALAAVVGTVAGAWAVWTGAIKVWQTATKIATALQAAFNAVMNVNPIMLVVTGLAALAAGFAYLWTHSKGFRDFWIGLWDKIKSVVSTAVGWFKSAVSSLAGWFKSAWSLIHDYVVNPVKAAWQWVVDRFNDAKSWIGGVTGKIAGAFKSAWGFIHDYIVNPVKTAWQWVKDKFSAVAGWIDGAVTKITKGFRNAWNWIRDYILSPIKTAWNWVSDKFKDVAGWIGGAIDKVTGVFKKAWGFVYDYIVTPIKNAIQWVKDAIGALAQWMANNPVVQMFAPTAGAVASKAAAATGGGGGGFGGQFGGPRASGGPVYPGKVYLVGEKRPELFVPNTAGKVLPKVPAGGGNTYQFNMPAGLSPMDMVREADRLSALMAPI